MRIPAGVRHGDVLYAEGGGDAGSKLELCIELASHKLFELDGDGVLRCQMPVDGFAWVANRWIDVPTLKGLHQMRLQRGCHAYRLRGQGFPLAGRGEAGDFIVTVVPVFPSTLSADQEALLDQLMATGGDDGPMQAWRGKVRAWERTRSRTRRTSRSG